MRHQLAESFGLLCPEILFFGPKKGVEKTKSGKPRRNAIFEKYLEESWKPLYVSKVEGEQIPVDYFSEKLDIEFPEGAEEAIEKIMEDLGRAAGEGEEEEGKEDEKSKRLGLSVLDEKLQAFSVASSDLVRLQSLVNSEFGVYVPSGVLLSMDMNITVRQFFHQKVFSAETAPVSSPQLRRNTPSRPSSPSRTRAASPSRSRASSPSKSRASSPSNSRAASPSKSRRAASPSRARPSSPSLPKRSTTFSNLSSSPQNRVESPRSAASPKTSPKSGRLLGMFQSTSQSELVRKKASPQPERSNFPQSSPSQNSPAQNSPAQNSPAWNSPARNFADRSSPTRNFIDRNSPLDRNSPRKFADRSSPTRNFLDRNSPPPNSTDRNSPARKFAVDQNSPTRNFVDRNSPPQNSADRNSPARKFAVDRNSPPQNSADRISPAPKFAVDRNSPPNSADRISPAPKFGDRNPGRPSLLELGSFSGKRSLSQLLKNSEPEGSDSPLTSSGHSTTPDPSSQQVWNAKFSSTVRTGSFVGRGAVSPTQARLSRVRSTLERDVQKDEGKKAPDCK